MAHDAKFLAEIHAKAIFLASTAKPNTSKMEVSQFFEEPGSSVVEPGTKKRGKQGEAEKAKISASHNQAMRRQRDKQMVVFLEESAVKPTKPSADSSSSLSASVEQPEKITAPKERQELRSLGHYFSNACTVFRTKGRLPPPTRNSQNHDFFTTFEPCIVAWLKKKGVVTEVALLKRKHSDQEGEPTSQAVFRTPKELIDWDENKVFFTSLARAHQGGPSMLQMATGIRNVFRLLYDGSFTDVQKL